MHSKWLDEKGTAWNAVSIIIQFPTKQCPLNGQTRKALHERVKISKKAVLEFSSNGPTTWTVGIENLAPTLYSEADLHICFWGQSHQSDHNCFHYPCENYRFASKIHEKTQSPHPKSTWKSWICPKTQLLLEWDSGRWRACIAWNAIFMTIQQSTAFEGGWRTPTSIASYKLQVTTHLNEKRPTSNPNS